MRLLSAGRLVAVLALVALVACQDPVAEEMVQPGEPTSNELLLGPGSNQPPGLATLNDQPWNTLPSDPSNPWGWNATGNVAIRTTTQEGLPAAPESSPNVLRLRVNPGQVGYGSVNTWYRFAPSGQGVSELYWAYWVFFPSDFVNECTGLKQFWPRWHNHTNSPFTIFHRRDLWQYQVRQQGPGVSALWPSDRTWVRVLTAIWQASSASGGLSSTTSR